jgi:hypothetical protein
VCGAFWIQKCLYCLITRNRWLFWLGIKFEFKVIIVSWYFKGFAPFLLVSILLMRRLMSSDSHSLVEKFFYSLLGFGLGLCKSPLSMFWNLNTHWWSGMRIFLVVHLCLSCLAFPILFQLQDASPFLPFFEKSYLFLNSLPSFVSILSLWNIHVEECLDLRMYCLG